MRRRGFSLAEIVIGSFIMLLVAGFVASSIGVGTRFITQSRERSIALRIAQSQMAQWRANVGPFGSVSCNAPYDGYQVNTWTHDYPDTDPTYVTGAGNNVQEWYVQVVGPSGITVQLETLEPNIPAASVTVANKAPNNYIFFNGPWPLFNVQMAIDSTNNTAASKPVIYPPLPKRPTPPPSPGHPKIKPFVGKSGTLMVAADLSIMYVSDTAHGGIVVQNTPLGTPPTSPPPWPRSPWLTKSGDGSLWLTAPTSNASTVYGAWVQTHSMAVWTSAANHFDIPFYPLAPLPVLEAPQCITTNNTGSLVWVGDGGLMCLRSWVPNIAQENSGWNATQIKPGTVGNQMGIPRGIAVVDSGATGGGDVFVADARTLWHLDAGGNLLGQVPLPTNLVCTVMGMAYNHASVGVGAPDCLYLLVTDGSSAINYIYKSNGTSSAGFIQVSN
jgi:hypothetical protein